MSTRNPGKKGKVILGLSSTHQEQLVRHSSKYLRVYILSPSAGYPKPLTYTQGMMAMGDAMAAIPDLEECFVHHFVQKRLYTPLPSLHVRYPASVSPQSSIDVKIASWNDLSPS